MRRGFLRNAKWSRNKHNQTLIMEKKTPKRRSKNPNLHDDSPSSELNRELKEVKKLILKQGYKAAFSVVELSAPHSVWKLLAEAALKGLDFEAAETAFVRCRNYPAIKFCERVSKLQSDGVKRAEVHAFFGEYDAAEKVLLDIDRRDLAIDLRKTMCHYSQVLDLMREGLTDDMELKRIKTLVGDYYSHRMDHETASRYYFDDIGKLFNSYLAIEDFNSMKKLIDRTNDVQMLMSFASVFESVGMCQEAVEAFVKSGHTKEAVRCCVSLNEWKTALSQDNDITDSLLTGYAGHLLQEGKLFDVVQLYKKANRLQDASHMLIKIIQDHHVTKSVSSASIMKQFYCLIGILHSQSKNVHHRSLTSLLREDESLLSLDLRVHDNPWKGCEAFHFYLLAHQLFYGKKRNMSVDDAMKTALRLMDYEDFLDQEDIYSLIALTSCANKNLAIASRAFIKLETLESIPEDRRIQYLELSTDLFSKHVPKESRNIPKVECSSCAAVIPDYLSTCSSCNTNFATCIQTGRPIMDTSVAWTCQRCNHHALKDEVKDLKVCPLCHFPVNDHSW